MSTPSSYASGGSPASENRPRTSAIEWKRPRVPGQTPPRTVDLKPAYLQQADWETIGRGDCSTMYEILGAHPSELDGKIGTRFAVWAPNAREVCVIADCNGWRHGQTYLNSSNTGVWTGFVPDMHSGTAYKYSIRTVSNAILEKADPYAFYSEQPPKTASIIYDLDGYQWRDEAWLEQRAKTNWSEEPVSVYEVHLGSWKHPRDGRRYYNYRELARMLVDYCREMGYTHIELMPVNEHPFDGSWGYQVTGYFAPTSRFGEPHDFMYFVDYCHQAGLGVLVDWVPGHFPTDAHSLGKFDGTALYEHADPRQGFHPDWGTYIFNYGRSEVREFLLSSARIWMDKFHVDGLRVDAVASMLYLDYSRESGDWIPNRYGGRENLEAIDFLRQANTILHGDYPGTMVVAEESTAWGGVSRPVYDGGLGFTMKWDMGWMNDTLRYLHRDPIHRTHHQSELSFRMIYAFTENFLLPLSHDEVVHGKRSLLSQMPGDYWQQFANLRLLYSYQFTSPGKKLQFMGGEFGQWTEWNHDSELDWALLGYEKHDGLRRLVGDLNRLYRDNPALHEGDFTPDGFAWIQCDDWQNSIIAFRRMGIEHKDQEVIVVCNFTPIPRDGYRLGVTKAGFYKEVFNSDAGIYGGANIGNIGGMYSEPIPAHGMKNSIAVAVPPLAAVMFSRKA